MKTLSRTAFAVACLLGAAGAAQAQGSSPSDAAITNTAVGGMPSAGMQAGGPASPTRAQVRQELSREQKSGELGRINQLYNGSE